jgi:hypothetical protein
MAQVMRGCVQHKNTAPAAAFYVYHVACGIRLPNAVDRFNCPCADCRRGAGLIRE